MKITYLILAFIITLTTTSLAKDIETLITKCDKNDFQVCVELGTMYMKGDMVEKNPKKAIGLFEKACNGGDMIGCRDLAFFEKDPKKAYNIYLKACDKNEVGSCYEIARRYYYGGDMVDQDYEKSLYFYQKACTNGMDLGCRSFANLHTKVCASNTKAYCSKYK